MTDLEKFNKIKYDNSAIVFELTTKRNRKNITSLYRNNVLVAERAISSLGVTYRFTEDI